MWIDDSGAATEANDATGHDGEMEIVVDGQSYTAEANMDLDHDGVYDTVRMDNEDGTITAYVDTDGDGDADAYIHTDTEGNVVAEATYDSSTGTWVAAGDDAETGAEDSETAHSGSITAETDEGTVVVGPATVDSNNDGTADTAIVTDEQGNTVLYTDVDGDGKADVGTVVSPTGETHTYEHTGSGEWTERSGDGSGLAADSDKLWGGPGYHTVEGVAKIDSLTGQWISQN